MTTTDWKARAEREAAALLDASGYLYVPGGPRNASEAATRGALVALLAAAWLQGMNLGCHETLAEAEQAFERLKAAL